MVKVGLAPAFSCTAWFVRPLLFGAKNAIGEGVAGDFPEAPPYIPPPVQIGGNLYLKGYIGMTNQRVGALDNVL